MLDYLIFDTKEDIARANGRWIYEMYKKGDILKDRKERKDSKKNTAWDFGKELENGKWACEEPKEFKNVFSKGIKENKSKLKFKEV